MVLPIPEGEKKLIDKGVVPKLTKNNINIKKAEEKLSELIEEIESDGFLAEHSCIFLIDDLKAILKLLEKKE